VKERDNRSTHQSVCISSGIDLVPLSNTDSHTDTAVCTKGQIYKEHYYIIIGARTATGWTGLIHLSRLVVMALLMLSQVSGARRRIRMTITKTVERKR